MTPRKLLSIPFFLGLALGVLGTAVGADVLGSSVFPDMQPGTYFDAPVGRLYGAGIIKGAGDGNFHPADFVTRADVAVMLDRALNGSTPISSRSSSRSSSSSSEAASSSSSSSAASVGAAGAFRFAVDKVTIGEGSANLSLSVIRYGGSAGNALVKYATADGSAKAGARYNEATGTVAFGDGETSKLVKLTLVNNLIADPNESFTVSLKEPTGGAVVGTPATATITILDNDGGGVGVSSSSSSSGPAVGGNTITFSAWEYAVDENAGAITVAVLRKGNTTAEVKVNYATADGSAQTGTHYAATQGTLVFAAGETSKSFSVQVSDNGSIEGNRKATLKLSSPVGASLADPSSVPLTIVDNEANPSGSGSLYFSSDVYSTTEKQESVTITVLRRGGYTGTATVKYTTTDSTATGGTDYTSVTGTLTFAPNESSKSFTIPVVKDTLTEGEEKVNLTLSDITGATYGVVTNAQLKITDQ